MRGFLVQSGELANRPDETAHIRTRPSPAGERKGQMAEIPSMGSFQDHLPVELNALPRAEGYIARSFSDDYYHTIHLIPDHLDFGAVSGETVKDVRLWNAHLEPVVLNRIIPQNMEGVRTLEGPVGGYTASPLAILHYRIEAQTQGPAAIDGRFLFTFSSGETPVLHIVGTRAKRFLFPPNWRKPFSVEYRFRTEIITSWSGKEQRRSLRVRPRKRVHFETSLNHGRLREFNGLVSSWQARPFIFPDYSRQAKLVDGVSTGDHEVMIAAPVPEWLVESASVIILEESVAEAVVVDSVSGNRIRFKTRVARSWNRGALIHPGIAGYLEQKIRSKRSSDEVANIEISFDVPPTSEPVLPVTQPARFNGVPVFEWQPDWGNQPQMDYESFAEILDYGTGKTVRQTPVPFNTTIKSYTFSGRRDHLLAIIGHFCRMKGKRGEFYMSTFENDIRPTRIAGAGVKTLEVGGHDFYRNFNQSPIYRAICIQYPDGSHQNNRVASIFKSGKQTAIQMKDPLVQEIHPETIRKISWLLVHRHATDQLRVEWLTDQAGRCRISTQTLEDMN